MYEYIAANGVEFIAIWFAFEKLVNLVVGFTTTQEDDILWDKVKNVFGFVLNTRSKSV